MDASVNCRRCLTPYEYATEKKVSRRTVYRLIKAKKIPAERIGQQWRIWVSRRTSSDNVANL